MALLDCMDLFDLAQDFYTLEKQLGVENGEQNFDVLQQHYNEPERAYHDFAHIRDVLGALSEVQDSLYNPALVKIAAYYHDAIRPTPEVQGELLSANLAEKHHKDLNPEYRFLLSAHILATKNHNPTPGVPDSKYLIDADLLILGQDPQAYNAYTQKIREEYKYVPDEIFYSVRKDVMHKFLEREQIYFTELGKPYEQQAQVNLSNEIKEISQRP